MTIRASLLPITYNFISSPQKILLRVGELILTGLSHALKPNSFNQLNLT